MGCEVVAKFCHSLLVHAVERRVGNVMETDEIDSAFQSVQQSEQCFGVGDAVVDALEHDVLKRKPALMHALFHRHLAAGAKILLFQQFDDLLDAESLFGGHDFCTF